MQGSFTKVKMVWIGSGVTARKVPQRTYWSIRVVDDVIECAPLGSGGEESDLWQRITDETFALDFIPNFEYPTERNYLVGNEADNIVFLFSLYVKYNLIEKIATVLSLMKSVLKDQNGNVVELFLRVGIEIRRGKFYHEALDAYQYARDLDDTNWLVYFNIGRVYFDMRSYSSAVEYLLRTLDYMQGSGGKEREPVESLLRYMYVSNVIPSVYLERCKAVLA